MNNPNVRGFTILELVVVIAIIGVLSAIVFASFSDARENARDKTRMSDVGQIQLALKVYQQENTMLPVGSEIICTNTTTCAGDANDAVRTFVGDIEDPRHDGTTYFYEFTGTEVCANQLEQSGATYCQPIQ